MDSNVKCSFWRWIAALFFVGQTTVLAEQYLTVAEARQLCFPDAEKFQEKIFRFDAAQEKAIAKKTGARLKNSGNKTWLAEKDGKLLGVLVLDYVLGKHEVIDYVVAISPDGKVRQVEILEFRESHGNEIRSKKWRDQFRNKTSSDRLKLNDDIYNISGATISCRQITEGIKRVLATYEIVVRPGLAASGQLQQSAKKR